MASMYEPPAHIAHLVQEFEQADRDTAQSAENVLSDSTRVLPYVMGGDARARRIPNAFLERFDASAADVYGQSVGLPVVTIMASSRPEDLWIGDDIQTAEVVAELIASDLHCDVRMLDGTDFGSCVERHAHVADLYASVNGESARREYIAQHIHTVPFERGGTIVLCRVCDWCLNALLLGVDVTRCGVFAPADDGFGSVGMGPITEDEYRWNPDYVRSIVAELHEFYDRLPTIAELSAELLTREFKPSGGNSVTD